MAPTTAGIRSLRPQIEEIAGKFGVSRIRLFGSVVRGTAKEGSDVEMLVRFDSGRTLLDLVGFQQEVGELLGARVDVLSERAIHPLLAPAILGKVSPL